jgi:hypothetical protein
VFLIFRYRGLFYFENDYWLGSKQFCYEVNYEYRNAKNIPEMQFFVTKVIAKISPVIKKVKLKIHLQEFCFNKRQHFQFLHVF